MKKWGLKFSFIIILILVLSGCQFSSNDKASLLEEKVREYDRYAKLLDYQYGFEESDKTGLKVIVAHNEEDLVYIFQAKTPYRDNNEVEIYVNDELFYRYTHSRTQYEDIFAINASDLPDGDVFKLKFGWRIGVKEYFKELQLIKNIDDIDDFHIKFKDAKQFKESEFKSMDDYNKDMNLGVRFIVILGINSLVAVLLFVVYKIIYENHVKRKLTDTNYHRRLLDLNQFKNIIIGVGIISTIGLFFVSSYIHSKKIDETYTYLEGTLFQESVSGFNEEIMMTVTIPYSRKRHQTIIFEKPVGGRLHYDYYIEFTGTHNRSQIRMGGSGALVYKEIFEDVDYDTMEIRVYDLYKEEFVLYRKYHLNDFKHP